MLGEHMPNHGFFSVGAPKGTVAACVRAVYRHISHSSRGDESQESGVGEPGEDLRRGANSGGSLPNWGIVGGLGEDHPKLEDFWRILVGLGDYRRIVGELEGPPDSAGIPGSGGNPWFRSRIDGALRESAYRRNLRLRTGFVDLVRGPMPRAGIFG